MNAAVEIVNCRAEGKADGGGKAIAVTRGGKVLAILPPGDPLRRTLFLSARELRGVIANFPNIMRQNPEIRALMEAILESKIATGQWEPSSNRQ